MDSIPFSSQQLFLRRPDVLKHAVRARGATPPCVVSKVKDLLLDRLLTEPQIACPPEMQNELRLSVEGDERREGDRRSLQEIESGSRPDRAENIRAPYQN